MKKASRSGGGEGSRATVIVTAVSVHRGLTETLAIVRREAAAAGAQVLLVFNTDEAGLSAEDRGSVEPLVDRMLFESRPGKSAALNTAVAACSTELIAFTDDDALPAEGWLEALISRMEREPDLVGLGGRVLPLYLEGPPPGWYERLVGKKAASFLGPKNDLGGEPFDYAAPEGASFPSVPLGANCAWRRAVLLTYPYREALGPNRVTGMRGGEDTCVAMEILQAGGRVSYEPTATVHHPVAASRMTKEYVIDGYRCQGVEVGRILQVFGKTVENHDKWRRSAQRRPFPMWLQLIEGPYRTLKHQLRREFARAVCESLSIE